VLHFNRYKCLFFLLKINLILSFLNVKFVNYVLTVVLKYLELEALKLNFFIQLKLRIIPNFHICTIIISSTRLIFGLNFSIFDSFPIVNYKIGIFNPLFVLNQTCRAYKIT
jgi:hypothetical protein